MNERAHRKYSKNMYCIHVSLYRYFIGSKTGKLKQMKYLVFMEAFPVSWGYLFSEHGIPRAVKFYIVSILVQIIIHHRHPRGERQL